MINIHFKNKFEKKREIEDFFIAIFLILIGVIFRFLPHPPNFTPIGAIALFGGAFFSKKLALILPLIAMGISDLFLGFYPLPLMFFVYFSFLISVFLGFGLKKQKKISIVFKYSLLSSVLFFLLTNFAVWAFTGWYPKNSEGLIQCYFMALPFFRNTLLGNLFYSGIFFGVYKIIRSFIEKKLKVPKISFISKV